MKRFIYFKNPKIIMGLFWKTKTEKQFEQINIMLAHSFAKVKDDTSKLFEWINYLHQQNQAQQKLILELQTELKMIPKTKEQIKMIIDHYYSFGTIFERINQLSERVNKLVAAQMPILNNLEKVNYKVTELEKKPEPKANLREKILKRITKNSKTYVKNLILSFIRKYEKISALQLREMIVEEQELCSKSSFYRILEEIEQEEDVSVISDGKQKQYMFKIMKRH